MRPMAWIPVELWHNNHRVAVVYQSYGTMSSGAMVWWLQSCSSLQELHDFQWSYGTMIINFQCLDGSYYTIKFIVKYKHSLTNTILLAAHLVQLNSPNRNSTLQNQTHFLCQTVPSHYKTKFTSFTKPMETVLSNLTGTSTWGAIHSTVN